MSDLPDYQLPISIAAISIESIPVDIIAQSISHLYIDIVAQSVGNLNVNIAASAITVNVNISSQTGNLNVNVAASAVTLNVNISSQSGNINVNIAAQTSNLNINIAAQGIDLNIKTSGGANIVIDKLTQVAYTEDQRTLSNALDSFTDASITGNTRKAKFFPRGCRGFLKSIEVECRNTGGTDQTISIYISPQPYMNYILSGAITVPASGVKAYRTLTINKMWNYDSMFIFIVSSSVNIGVYYDSSTPTDAYTSADGGSTWASEVYRWHIKVNMIGQTIGDLPVTGVVNTVEIPASASKSSITAVNIPTATETSIITISGSGTLLQAHLMFSGNVDPTAAVYYVMYIYADGNYAMMITSYELTQSDTSTAGTNSEGEFLKRGVNYIMNVRIPIKFKYSLEIRAGQTTGVQQTVDAFITYNRIQ